MDKNNTYNVSIVLFNEVDSNTKCKSTNIFYLKRLSV